MNYTVDDLNNEVTQHLYFNTGLLSLYLFVGLAGNSCVLYIYTCKMKKTEERYFIPMLAVSDIFACLAGIIFGIVSNFNKANYQLETFCKVGYFFMWTTTSVSGFLILLIALNRHLMICRPTSPQLTVVWKRRALVVMASIVFVISLPILYFLGGRNVPYVYKGQPINTTLCTLRFSEGMMNQLQFAYFAFEIFLASLNMIITCGLYIPIGVSIYRRFRIIQQNQKQKSNSSVASLISGSVSSSPRKQRMWMNVPEKETSVMSKTPVNINDNVCATSVKRSENETRPEESPLNRRKIRRRKQVRHNFTLMFAMIIIIYVLAYVPTLILIMLPGNDPAQFWFSRSAVELNVLAFLQRTFLLNNIVNPFIYSYFDFSFRSELISLLICCRQKELRSTL